MPAVKGPVFQVRFELRLTLEHVADFGNCSNAMIAIAGGQTLAATSVTRVHTDC